MKKVLLLALVLVMLPFGFDGKHEAQAARSCIGQWPGSTMEVKVYDSTTGTLLETYNVSDPGETGLSSLNRTLNVSYGHNLMFQGVATAPDNNAPSEVWYPYASVPATTLEGSFQFVRVWQSTRPMDSDSFFSWTIDPTCNGTPDPDWDGGHGEIYLNLIVESTPTPTGTVCLVSNVTTHVNTSRTGGSGYSDDVTGGATATCHVGAALDTYTATGSSLAGYTGPTYDPGGQTQSLTTDGQTITFNLTYTVAVINCSGPSTQSCTSSANSCGQTSSGTQTRTCNTSNGTWSGWGACSASTPANPANYGNACTGTPSAPNACGQTGPGGAGTIQCDGSCSGATGTPPPNTCASTVTLSASPNPVTYGMASTLTWNSTNTVANSCAITGGSVVGGSTGLPVSGSKSTTNLTANTAYTATCTGLNGSPVSDSVTVNVGAAPVMNYFRCNGINTPGTCTVDYGGTAGLTWSSSNTTACSLTSTVPTDDGVIPTGSRNDTNITANRDYSIECWNGTSGVHAPALTLPLHVVVGGPSVDIKADGSNGPITVEWNANPTLAWTVANASSCVASAVPASGYGNWSGSKDASTGTHSQSTSNLTVPQKNTYTITCTGNGSASDSVEVTVNPPKPTVGPGDPTYTAPDYCSSGPGGYVTWSYSDPSGSTQTAYEVQITETGNFNNPFYDSGQLNSSSHVFSIPNGVLQFNLGYKARVRVWNTYNSASDWSNSTGTFNTPNYAYPDVEPPYQFTWSPTRPQQNKPVQFTDHTAFGGGNSNSREWNWNFGDGGTSTQQSPAHTYTVAGSYTITEIATDAANQSCGYSQSLNIQKPIPVIKEVAPK